MGRTYARGGEEASFRGSGEEKRPFGGFGKLTTPFRATSRGTSSGPIGKVERNIKCKTGNEKWGTGGAGVGG
jgi:hypothetical protein